MENRYQNGKIYKIVDNGFTKMYIGSTTQELSQRFTDHRRFYKKFAEGQSHFVSIFSLFEEFGVENCKILLLEEFPCNSKAELDRKEGEYILNTTCINKNVPGRTYKEYREHNKEKIKAYKDKYDKIYRETHKEYNKEYKKTHYELHKDEIREKHKNYYEENKTRLLLQRAEYDRNKRQNDPAYRDKERERKRIYDQKNKTKKAEYRAEHKEHKSQYDKVYWEQNKEKKKEYHKMYREQNKEKIKDKNKEYREANKDKIKEYQRNKYIERKNKETIESKESGTLIQE